MSDFFERARSTGVIGVSFIIFMLLGFGSLFLMVFDDRLNGENAAKLKDAVREQEFELYGLEDRVDWAKVKLLDQERIAIVSKELEQASKVLAVLTRKEADLTTQIESEKEALKKVSEEQLTYRDDYREFVRNKAVGEAFDELVLTSGKKLSNIKIREILPDKIRLSTEFGTTSIDWADAPEEWRERFQVGEGELEEYQAKLKDFREKRNLAVAENQSKRSVLLHKEALRKSLIRIEENLKSMKDRSDAAKVRVAGYQAKARKLKAQISASKINRTDVNRAASKAAEDAAELTAKLKLMNDKIADLGREKLDVQRELNRLEKKG